LLYNQVPMFTNHLLNLQIMTSLLSKLQNLVSFYQD